MGALPRFNLRALIPLGYNHLIETGCGRGWSTQYGVRQGMIRVDAVDATKEMYDQCIEMFVRDPHVHLTHGYSPEFLQTIDNYNNAIVFLDAHLVGGADFLLIEHEEAAKHPKSFPLLDELDVLLQKDISNTIIIIDDIRMYYENAGTKGKVPEFAKRWHELPKLEKRIQTIKKTHQIIDVPLDEGYFLMLPKDLKIPIENLLTHNR